MLVSLHLPKTAGTSFLRLLESHYGAGLLRDYDDRPLNRERWQRRATALGGCLRNALPAGHLRGIECIHGHFLPVKYRLLGWRTKVRFVVWLRDPVERLASHYFYWQRSYDPVNAEPLHRRVVGEGWDLERFCLGPELQNTYSQFLWAFPLSRFDFVGITERYAEDAAFFAREFLGTATPDTAPENVNSTQRAGDDTVYISDPGFRRAIEEHHAEDMALNQEALNMRVARGE